MGRALPWVLVVEDDPMIVAGLERIARRLPLRLCFVSTAEEAWPILERLSPVALLSDYRLPGTDGVTLLERARARFPALRCVLHTGEAVRRTSIPVDFPVVPKPCAPEDLREVLLSLVSPEGTL
jgi:two-component system, NtrC family, nitrogen regulation response regulator GlnG